MKAFLIDSTAREIRAVEYATLGDMQRFVGGYIEIVNTRAIGPGDTLYVDEEALYKPQKGFFMLTDYPQPLAGNGLIVGREIGASVRTAAPTSTIDKLQAAIRFLARDQADAWGKANASEPAVTFATFNKDGTVTEEVFQRFGSLFGGIPRPEGEDKK